MSITKKTLEENINKIFIETGTYKGHTSRLASEFGYNKVYTIELQERLYNESLVNLDDLIKSNKVEALLGDSANILPDIFKNINEEATILLDAHIDGGNFISGTTPNIRQCPLYDELNIIKNHHINTHTIIVDDVRILGEVGWGKEVVLDKIIEMIKTINKDYHIYYDDGEIPNDVLIAKIIK